MCCRLFTKYVPTHYCARGIEGTLIENNVNSFHDFVKSCALTLTPVDPESSSSTDCTVPTQRPSFMFEKMMGTVRHSPEKGAIPKLLQAVTDKKKSSLDTPQGKQSSLYSPQGKQSSINSPQGKQSRSKKMENAKEDIIILDTPPGPDLARSTRGKPVTTPEGEITDKHGVRKCDNGNLRFKVDATNRSADSHPKEETGHFAEMQSTSGVYTCETKFQNMVNIITAVSPPGSTTDLGLKGYIPEESAPGPSHRRATQVVRGDGKRGERSRSPSGASSEVRLLHTYFSFLHCVT